MLSPTLLRMCVSHVRVNDRPSREKSVKLGFRLTAAALMFCALPAKAGYSYEIFDMPGAANTYVLGMNDRGDVVGSFIMPGSNVAHGFSRVGGIYRFESIQGATEGVVADIDNAGRIVGNCPETICIAGGYVRSPTGDVQLLPRPDSDAWEPMSVNEQLQITGGIRILGVSSGFVWTGTNWTLLNFPGAYGTTVRDINASGTSVGDYATTTGGAAIWGGFIHDVSGFTDLRYPGATETRTWDINDSGEVVGVAVSSVATTGYVRHANGSYETLSVPGASYVLPEDINNRGQIAGYFWDGVASRGFIATPIVSVPEPQTYLLMVFGIFALTLLRRRAIESAPIQT